MLISIQPLALAEAYEVEISPSQSTDLGAPIPEARAFETALASATVPADAHLFRMQ